MVVKVQLDGKGQGGYQKAMFPGSIIYKKEFEG
jgi:hypothetical protein